MGVSVAHHKRSMKTVFGAIGFTLMVGGFGAVAQASDLNLSCSGENWTLELSGDSAQLVFPSPTDMDVMLDTPAEGYEFPRALTLVGDRDSAVLIIDRKQCGPSPYSAELLTQRVQTPIFLIGCCSLRE